ncbi:MAG: hypothetical protein IPM79_30735 [Polyangiaceae bacterium]|jgi:hypothetical protein|nr:hypothetical protein [Polyangiaceae bacterium]
MSKAVLYTLAQAAAVGEPELATQPAAAFDPLQRPFVKLAVKRAIAKARASTKSENGEHILRLAFLQTHGSAPQSVDDEEAVKAAFEQKARPFETAKKPTRVVTMIVVALGLLGIAGGLYLKFRASDDERFLKSPLGLAFSLPLSRYSTGQDAKADDARLEILSEPVKDQIGDKAFSMLEDALDARGAFVGSKEPFPIAAKAASSKGAAFNEALEKKGLPAFLVLEPLQTDVGVKKLIYYAYHVQERAELGVGDQKLKVVWGYRMDDAGGFGWVSINVPQGSDYAVVNLSEKSELWTQLIVPHIVRQTASGQITQGAPEEMTALEKRLRTVMKDELRECVKIEDAAVERIASLLEQRHDRYVSVEKSFKIVLDKKTVFQNPTKRVELDKMRNDPLVDEAIRWDDKLRDEYEPVTKAIAPFAALDEEIFLYGLLLERSNKPQEAGPDAVDTSKFAGRYRTAGMLSAFGHERACYALDLHQFVFQALQDKTSWGRREARVAALSGILGELGLATVDQWYDGRLDEKLLATALDEALRKKPGELRAAAKAAYVKEFGADPEMYKREKK